MFYDQSSIEKLLKCQSCNQFYDTYEEPRILPCCGKTLCGKCIERIEKDIKNNLFKCVMCDDECTMPKKRFPINELVARLVLEQPKDVYRGEVCEEFKINLFNLESLVNKLNYDMNHGEDSIKEHCIELRRMIQLATEKKIQELIAKSELLIQRVHSYEQDTVEKYAKNTEYKKMLSTVVDEVNSFLKDQKRYLSQFIINENEIGFSNMKLEELRLKVEENLNIKKTLFDNRLMSFGINKTQVDESLIGNISFERIDTTLTKIISSSADETIKIWDFHTGECLQTIVGHTNWVRNAKFLSNDKVISCSDDNTIKIWDLTTKDCIRTFVGHTKPVYSIQPVANDKLISCSLDKTIKIWSLRTGYCLRTLEGHTDSVYRILILSNELMISSSSDTKIKLWNYITGDCISTLTGHTHSVYCIDIITNDTIVSGSEDMTIRVWDINTGECLKTLLGHTKYVWCLKVLSIEQVLSGSGDETIKLWNIISGVPLKTFKCYSGIILDILILSNERFVSASSDKTIKIWDLNSGSLLRSMEDHSQRVISIQAV